MHTTQQQKNKRKNNNNFLKGRGSKQTSSQRKHIDSQHEKVLNITNHQGNTNQNHNEISPHTFQDDTSVLDGTISCCKLINFKVLVEGVAWVKKMDTTSSETHDKKVRMNEFITLQFKTPSLFFLWIVGDEVEEGWNSC